MWQHLSLSLSKMFLCSFQVGNPSVICLRNLTCIHFDSLMPTIVPLDSHWNCLLHRITYHHQLSLYLHVFRHLGIGLCNVWPDWLNVSLLIWGCRMSRLDQDPSCRKALSQYSCVIDQWACPNNILCKHAPLSKPPVLKGRRWTKPRGSTSMIPPVCRMHICSS